MAPPKGFKHTDEAKLRMSETKKGYKQTEEHKRKIGEANRGKKRKPFSEEQKRKMGEAHKGFKHSEESKLKMSLSLKGKIVSEKTRQKMSENHADFYGDKNPSYNPNKTDEERLDDRSHPEYDVWRKLVYTRDNFTCQKCGSKKSGTLNAHHIEGYSYNKELRTTVSNGITLCVPCHKDFHHQYGIESTATKVVEFLK